MANFAGPLLNQIGLGGIGSESVVKIEHAWHVMLRAIGSPSPLSGLEPESFDVLAISRQFALIVVVGAAETGVQSGAVLKTRRSAKKNRQNVFITYLASANVFGAPTKRVKILGSGDGSPTDIKNECRKLRLKSSRIPASINPPHADQPDRNQRHHRLIMLVEHGVLALKAAHLRL